MDVRIMTGGWSVSIAGTGDEDPAEYFDGHEDVGKLRDHLVGGVRLTR